MTDYWIALPLGIIGGIVMVVVLIIWTIIKAIFISLKKENNESTQ